MHSKKPFTPIQDGQVWSDRVFGCFFCLLLKILIWSTLVVFLGSVRGEAGQAGLGQRLLLFCSGRGLSCLRGEKKNPAQSYLNATRLDSK